LRIRDFRFKRIFKIRWAILGLFALTMTFKKTNKQQQNVMPRGIGPLTHTSSIARSKRKLDNVTVLTQANFRVHITDKLVTEL